MFRSAFILALLTAVCGIGGCDKAGAGGPPASLAEVRLAYFANVTHAQAVLGVASGEFQNALAPIKLKTTVFNAGPELMQALNGGQIDIAYVGPGPVISATPIAMAPPSASWRARRPTALASSHARIRGSLL